MTHETTPSPIVADASGALFVNTREAARRLNLSKTTGYELVKTGRLRSVRIGSRVLVPVGEVERFAAELLAAGSVPSAYDTTAAVTAQ